MQQQQQPDTTLTFPTPASPPQQFTFPELLMSFDPGHPLYHDHGAASAVQLQQDHHSPCSPFCSELSSTTSTPFVSAPSSPTSSFRASHFSSTPSSPSRTQFLLNFSRPQPYSLSLPHQSASRSAGHPLPPHIFTQTESYHGSSSSHHTEQHPVSPSPGLTTLQSSSPGHSFRADYTSAFNWRHRSLQAEEQDNKPFTDQKQSTYHETRVSSTESPRTEQQRNFILADQARMYEKGPDRPVFNTQHSSPASVQVHHARSRSWWTQKTSPQTDGAMRSSVSQKPSQAEHVWSLGRSYASPKRSDSQVTQDSSSIVTKLTNHTAFQRQLQADDNDAEYSRKDCFTSAVPFSWEEKPGTPKARSVTSEVSHGEDDSSSTLLSDQSSDFEFSARFLELEETPMSPTPISSTFHSFKHQHASGSPRTLTHMDLDAPSQAASYEQTIWPLRLPPRLDDPVLRMKRSTRDEENEPNHSYDSIGSLSAPQSPRSLQRFDIRGVLCGMSSPRETEFDPFAAAMENSMADEEMAKSPKKNQDRVYENGRRHHRRTRSLSPLRVFHWDDHAAKSNSSSNGSSTDEVKNKHPVQREINARQSAETPKGLKKWSLKGLLLHGKGVSSRDSGRHSNTSASSWSSAGRESCSSPGVMREEAMDASLYTVEDNGGIRGRDSVRKQASIPSTPSSILSPSSSTDSSRGMGSVHKANKGAYAFHYGGQRAAQTEELRKRTFLPYKQGLLGCLGLSSKGYRAISSLSKPLQSVS